MIIKLLFEAVLLLFEVVLGPIQFPSLPDGVVDYFMEFTQYVNTALGILAVYVDLEYLLSLFVAVAAIDGCVILYKIVMWILRKIPMLGMS